MYKRQTIARSIEDYPSSSCFGDQYRNFYTEDIYVGYRYFETTAKDKVLYPFGFGLSYTHFSMETLEFAEDSDSVSLKIAVANEGEFPGRQVVQVYVNPPQGVLGKPLRSLASFAKTRVLMPGEKDVYKRQELYRHRRDTEEYFLEMMGGGENA